MYFFILPIILPNSWVALAGQLAGCIARRHYPILMDRQPIPSGECIMNWGLDQSESSPLDADGAAIAALYYTPSVVRISIVGTIVSTSRPRRSLHLVSVVTEDVGRRPSYRIFRGQFPFPTTFDGRESIRKAVSEFVFSRICSLLFLSLLLKRVSLARELR